MTVNDWIKQEQGKHFCHCGCETEIKILAKHHCGCVGIPKYIKHHNLITDEMKQHKGTRKKGEDNPRYKKVKKTCMYCNNEYLIVFSKKNVSRFCSKGCKNKYNGFLSKWVKDQQGKHFCQCGCGVAIEIKRHHHASGIPKYIKGHNCKNGNHHLYGIKYSDEHKQKLSDAHKGLQVGDKNPAWNGGTSFLPYCHKFNNQLKERVRNRDNRTCQNCGTKENGKRLAVHHIHYDKENCYPDLIALCNSCNIKANGNREYWEEYYMNILDSRGLLNWS